MKSGLYPVPGDSATARAAAAASRFAAPDDEAVEPHLRAQRGAHAAELPAASRCSTSSEIPFSVSNTPWPCRQSAPKLRHAAEVQRVVELVRAQDQVARQVLLVVLEHHRELADVDALREEVLLEVLQALDVVVVPPRLAVGHEDDAVRALEHQLPGGVVVAPARARCRAGTGSVNPLMLPRSIGRKSKKSVRSDWVASDTIRPRRPSGTRP